MEKTFDAAEAEPRIYADWMEAGAFRAGANASREDTFSIMIPPPNVTGNLHMGHAFNNTLQDILIRWHRMRGFDTLWQPGTDHAGIATQMVVERELAKTNRRRTDFSREDFIDLVWEQKRKSRGNIRGQLERLGASCDWDREAFTMAGAPGDPEGTPGGQNFHDAVIRVFVDMYDKGLIYRGKRLVNWDPHFETAISDLEVEPTEVQGHMWHFKYPLAGGATYEYVEKDEDGNEVLRETRDYISIATTRPETMLGDGAVAVHPSDERYAPIVGKLCEIPVGPKEHRRKIPIITDDYPDPTFGSGAVKITGAHDFNDYGVAKRGNIPCYRLMDTRAAMRDDGAPYAEAAARAREIAEGADFTEAEVDTLNLVPDELRGLDRFEARDLIVLQITAEGLAAMTNADDTNTSPPTIAIEGRRKRKEFGVWKGPEGEYYVKETVNEAINEARLRYPSRQVRVAIPEDIADDDGQGTFYDPMSGEDIVWLQTAYPLVESKLIMQPFGDRSKVVIEPMLTDQWFVDAEKIVGPAIDAVKDGTVAILPEQDKKVYFNWLENIEPWCISRQLWWGHQIPVWYGPSILVNDPSDPSITSDDNVLLDYLNRDNRVCVETSEEAVRQLSSLYPNLKVIEASGFLDALSRYTADKSRSRQTDTVYVYRDEDVLDTWFSSGLWPIGTLGWPENTPELQKYFPTSVLVTGFDIIFFWVARMMMMQHAVLTDRPMKERRPFDTVYVHALVRDEKGKKMSKSLGNVLDPLDLVDEFGADAVRFTLTSMAAMGRDLKLSTQRIAGYRNFSTKIWNAVRFAEMNGVYEAGPPAATPPAATATANRWIVGETARVRETVDAALDAYRFNDAANALYAHTWGKVCDWYVEFAKPLLNAEDPATVAETRATMGWVLDQCLILLHPIMPFVTEELWQTTGSRDRMLVHAAWPDYTAADLLDPAADREMNWVIGLIEEIRSARAQMHVPAGLQIPVLQLELDTAGRAAWDRNAALIRRLARIESLTEADEAPKGAITVAVEGGLFCLPLAEIIDVGEEKARLARTLGKLEKEIGGLKGRLSNPKFAESAPEAVVEETRENLAAREDEASKLKAALERLAEVA